MKHDAPKKAGVLQRPTVLAARTSTPSPKPTAHAAAPAGAAVPAAIPTRVVATIAFFVAILAAAPLVAYGLSYRVLYPGDSLRAAIIAVVAVNAVLFLYVLVAFSGIVDGAPDARPKTD